MIDQLSQRNRAIRDALLVAQQDPQLAIQVLTTALSEARREGVPSDIAALAKHAGAICYAHGDLIAAVTFYVEAVAAVPTDAALQLALAGVLRDLGRNDEARQAVLACLREVSVADDDLAEVARLMLAQLNSEC